MYSDIDDPVASHDSSSTGACASADNVQSSFNIENPDAASTGTINKVMLVITSRQTDSERITPQLVIGGTAYSGSNITPDATYTSSSNVWATNPSNGLPWTWSDITNLELGFLSTQLGGSWLGTIYVTQAYIVVNYEKDTVGGGATFAADEDTPITDVAKQTTQRLRLEVSNEGDAATSSALRLEYATSSGASTWTQVGAASAHWVMKDSTYIDCSMMCPSTTDNLGLFNEAAAFTAGEIKDDGAQIPSISLSGDTFTELEYSITATTTAINGQTYYFRVTNAGTAINTYSIYASATIAAGVAAADLTQIHYRWRNRDGYESEAEFKAATNTPILDVGKNTTQRIRIEVSNEGAGPSASTSFRLEYAGKSGTCQSTPTSSWTALLPFGAVGSEHWQMIRSVFLTEDEPTTNVTVQGGLPDEEPGFKEGYVKESSSTGPLLTLDPDQFTELEYAIKANSTATSGQTYCFRLTDNGTALPSYISSAYPEATIATGRVSGTLISAIFDTRNPKGATLNSIIWHGDKPLGTLVEFQIAASNTSTPLSWDYKGPNCTTAVYSPLGSGFPLAVDRTCHNNYRYYRYKVILWTNEEQTASPRVDDIVLNWSR